MKAAIPDNESERISTLHKYQILDTNNEETFDDVTRIAAHICNVPIALISLIDEDRQWFKSKIGLEVSETHRDFAFCSHAILEDDLLIVPDATKDKRFADNPLVTGEPLIRFYAGVPLITSDHHAIGTLCVIDSQPRELNKEQKEVLRSLARQVESLLELRHQTLVLAENNERLEQEVESRRLIEEAAKKSEGYHNLFNFANDSIIIFEPEKEIVLDVNIKACETYGLKREEFIGRSIKEMSWDVKRGDQHIEKLLEQGVYQAFETVQLRSDGTPIHFLINSSIINFNGKRAVLSINRDITERKKLEIAREESETRFHRAFNHAPIGMALVAPNGRWLQVNKSLCEMVGYTEEELLATNFQAITHLDDLNTDLDYLRQLVEDRIQSYQREKRYIHKHGHIVWITLSVSLVRDNENNPLYLISQIQDITDRKHTEEALHRAMSALDATHEGVFMFDPETLRFFYVNEGAIQQTGYSRYELLQMTPLDIKPEFNEETFRAMISPLIVEGAGSRFFTTVQRRKDNLDVPVETILQYVTFDHERVFIAMARDITERKHAEQELKESEARYRGIIEDQTELICRYRPDGTLTFVNEAYCRYFNKTREELVDFNLLAFLPDIEHERVKQHIAALTPKNSVFMMEHRVVNPYGEISWHEWTDRALFNENNELVELQAVGQDITSRKRAEHYLRAQYGVTLALAESSTLDEAIPKILLAVGETLGWELGEYWVVDRRRNTLTNSNIWSTSIEATDWIERNTQRSLSSGEGLPGRIWQTKELLWVNDLLTNPDFNRKEIAASLNLNTAFGFPIKLRNEVLGVLLFFNREHRQFDQGKSNLAETISNQIAQFIERHAVEDALKESEAKLVQAQKMESIGTLAGGIAHDFNNLLTAINGYSDLALRRTENENPIRRNLEEVRKAGDRAATLTRQLLAFSRRQQLERSSLSINDLIADILKMLGRIIGEDIDIKIHPAVNLQNIYADRGQIEQVIMNLVVNSRDAMPKGGKLIIETNNITLDKDYCLRHAYTKPGKFVQLMVSDTGTGMNEEIIGRIFEPFYTTKEVGKGTGLGLSMVYGIIKQHDGYIEVYSEPSYGTTFKIYLPCEEEAHIEISTNEKQALRSGTETILIAEDEESLRELGKEMLASLGYRIITAKDGTEAVELYEQHQAEIALVLMDVVMPHMGGVKAYEKIRDMNQSVPIVFMTGYSGEMLYNHFDEKKVFESDPRIAFLQKPYGIDSIGSKIRESLDREYVMLRD